jgi:hypothetical protein
MLTEARAKGLRLGISDRCAVVRGDFFAHDFDGAVYDTVLRMMLDSSGRFLVLDSAWSPERSKFNAKVERQPRRLNDGTAFEIYKRYCDRGDISRWMREYDVRLEIEHFGAAFYAVSGTFARAG